MNNDVNLIMLVISGILINNFVLSRILGICPFLGVSGKVETAVSMGLAVTFVMAMASVITWLVYYGLMVPFDLEYLRTIVFILVIAALVQFVEMVIKKISPPLYGALGVYLPLITTNCAVLGVALININEGYSLIATLLSGVAGALGFTLAIVLMAGIRERLELSNIPKPLRGFPITLITAGLMAVAFMGFSGIGS